MVAVYCCTLEMICHTMSFLWVPKTLSCLELLRTMVTITVFVFLHLIVHLPPLILYCNSCLFSYSPSLYLNFLLIGDFNVNLLDTSSTLYHSLHDILSSFNLLQVVEEPTRVASCGTASLIDLVLMSNPSSLQHCSVIPPLSNSDHNGVELSIKWKSGNPKHRPQTIGKFSLQTKLSMLTGTHSYLTEISMNLGNFGKAHLCQSLSNAFLGKFFPR